MADISKIQLSDDTQYNLKDAVARSLLTENDTSTGDISKIQLSDNTQYNIKDAVARQDIETVTTDVKAQVNADKDLINGGDNFIDDETLDDYDDKIAEMQESYKKYIPIQTASGTEIQLDNSNNNKVLVDIGLDGNIEQDGEPTPDNPVEGKTVTGENTIDIVGKNLLANNSSSQTISGISYVVNSNKSISFSGTATATNDFYIVGTSSQYIDLKLNDGSYTLSGCTDGSGTTYMLYVVQNRNGTLSYYQQTTTGLNLTIQKGDTFRIFIRVMNGQTVSATISPQLEQGSTATTYEPYQSQSYDINLGKNLNFTPYKDGTSKTTNGITFTVDDEGKVTANNTATANAYFYLHTQDATPYWSVPKGIYTMSGCPSGGGSSSYQLGLRLYKDTTSVANFYDYGNGATVDTRNYDYNRILFYIYIPNGTTCNNMIFSPMLKRGSAGSYAPYFDPIELAKISTYKDKIYNDDNDKKWYLRKEIGKIVLNGTETWVYDNDYKYFRSPSYTFTSLNAPLEMTSAIKPTYNQYCNLFTINKNWSGAGSFRDSTTTQGLFYPVQNAGYKILFRNLDYTTTTDFANWVASNNIIIYYPLATPTNTEITNETLISQLEAVKLLSGTQNNFTIDADTLPTLNLNYIEEANSHL